MDPKAFYQLTYGLFLLSAKDEKGDNACIINTAPGLRSLLRKIYPMQQ